MWGITGALGGSWPSLCACTLFDSQLPEPNSCRAALVCLQWPCQQPWLLPERFWSGAHYCNVSFAHGLPLTQGAQLGLSCKNTDFPDTLFYHGSSFHCGYYILDSAVDYILDSAAQWLCCASAEKHRNQIALWGWQADRLAAAIWGEWFHFHVLTKNKTEVIKCDSSRRRVLWQSLHFHPSLDVIMFFNP